MSARQLGALQLATIVIINDSTALLTASLLHNLDSFLPMQTQHVHQH